MEFKILDIDVIPEVDPYHSDTCTSTRSALEIDPVNRRAKIYQRADSGEVSFYVWNGTILEHVFDNPGPDEKQAREFLEGPEGQKLLERIAYGFSIVIEGYAKNGYLDSDAQEAYKELVRVLTDEIGPTEWQLWEVDDYLDPVQISADTSDEALKKMAHNFELSALHDKVILSGSVLRRLHEKRTLSREQEGVGE